MMMMNLLDLGVKLIMIDVHGDNPSLLEGNVKLYEQYRNSFSFMV